jgi:hypothetical protein
MRISTNDDDFDDCLEPCFSADFRKPVWRATIPWYLLFSPRYERLVAKVAEILRDTRPDRKGAKANMQAYTWDGMKDWPLTGAIETDEKMATDLAGAGYHINRDNLLVLESKADMQKRGQASPDDGDALALTFAQSEQ